MRLSYLSVSVVVAVLAGCGPEPVAHPDVAPAAGTVLYNGSPVSGAAVSLFSETSKDKGWTVSGQTDSAGKFEILSKFAPGTEFKGAPPGDYTIVVTKFDAPSGAVPKDMAAYEEQFKRQAQAATSGERPDVTTPKSAIPTRYSQEALSPLKVKLDAAGNPNIDVKLED